MNVYIASSWKNRERVRALAIRLREDGHEVYDFTDPACRKAPEIPPEKFPEQFDPERHVYRAYLRANSHWGEAVEGNRLALIKADAVVLLLPCGNDSHADWAFGLGTGAVSCVVGHPAAGERTPSHLWADVMFDHDSEVPAWLAGVSP